MSTSQEVRVEVLEMETGMSESIILECAKLYCGIWKEPPWNEDFWQPKEVASNLQRTMKKQSFCGFITTNDEMRPVGFVWGYQVFSRDLEEIAGHTGLNKLFLPGERVFYLAELGIASGYRQHGIAKLINVILLNKLKEQKISQVVLRTDMEAVAARTLYVKLGFSELPVVDAKHTNRTYWTLRLT